jgi:hypothetical protein
MVARAFIFVGNCLGLLGWGVFGFQCWYWFRFGSWMPLELWEAWVWLGGPLANSYDLAWHPKYHHLDFPHWSGLGLASNWVFDRFSGIPFCKLPKESYLIGSRTKFLDQPLD